MAKKKTAYGAWSGNDDHGGIPSALPIPSDAASAPNKNAKVDMGAKRGWTFMGRPSKGPGTKKLGK